jgi:hypothetical protein
MNGAGRLIPGGTQVAMVYISTSEKGSHVRPRYLPLSFARIATQTSDGQLLELMRYGITLMGAQANPLMTDQTPNHIKEGMIC